MCISLCCQNLSFIDINLWLLHNLHSSEQRRGLNWPLIFQQMLNFGAIFLGLKVAKEKGFQRLIIETTSMAAKRLIVGECPFSAPKL